MSGMDSPNGRSWYREWARRHAEVFALNSDAAADTLVAWQSIFASLRYTADELREATDVLARTPPKWLSEHLGAIHEAVRSRRDRLARTGGEVFAGDDDPGECVDCGNTGLAIVPHPKSVQHGVWVDSYTAAVYCGCRHGRRRCEAWERLPAEVKDRVGGRMFTLAEYERQVCPGWRQLVAEREELAAEARIRWRGRLAGKDRDGDERFGDYLDQFWRKHGRRR